MRVMPLSMANGSDVMRTAAPRDAWSNRIWMYQRSGRIAPQARGNPPIASTGKPTPA